MFTGRVCPANSSFACQSDWIFSLKPYFNHRLWIFKTQGKQKIFQMKMLLLFVNENRTWPGGGRCWNEKKTRMSIKPILVQW
jgi:hypothetical protein